MKTIVLRNIICFLCFTLICSFANAQVITIYNIENNKPIEQVYIYNENKTVTSISNVDGNVDITDFSDSDLLIFQHTSYKTEQYYKEEIEALGSRIFLRAHSIDLEEFIVSASRSKERISEVSNQIEIIDAKSAKLFNPQTTAGLLNQNGKVYIQKSQMGGGSPVIRGFEANKVLLVLDGVRMNNAIYRSGHVQNVISIDPAILERTEVIFGPGSLIYGSDALGGVMHFITKDPEFSKNKNGITSLNGMIRTSTANNELTGHLDFNLGFKNLAVLNSISFSDFGDLTIGKKRNHGNETWGLRPFFIGQNEEGNDEMITNDDYNELIGTGYRQIDILQKWKLKIASNQSLTANLQYSTTSNIPRFDRLNDYAEIPTSTSRGKLKFAQWDYGPQQRLLTSLTHRLTSNQNPAFDNINTTVAFQKIDEDRLKRKFGSEFITTNEEDVQVYSWNTDLTKALNNRNTLYYGLELNHNDVKSKAFNTSVADNTVSDEYVLSRYADNGSTMTTYAAYFKHKVKFSERFNLTEGLRYSLIQLNSSYSDNVVLLPIKKYKGNYAALTGGLGLNFFVTKDTRVSLNLGSGFRAPNIDDTGKFFDPQDGQVVVPNYEVEPEYLWNIDFGFQHKIMNKAVLNFNTFYNYIFNAIVRRPYQLNGSEYLVYDDVNSAIFSNQNAGEAQIYGLSTEIKVFFNDKLNFNANYNLVKGRDLTEDVPLGHIPPVFGVIGLNYNSDRLQSSIYLQYNAAKSIEDYSPFGEDKESEALESGSPKWTTTNFNMGYQINDALNFSAGVENIFDIHYIPFASGISGPGRNYIVSLRYSWLGDK